jgi:hypothetical protein
MPQTTALPSFDDVSLESPRSGSSIEHATYCGQTSGSNWIIPSADTQKSPAMALETGIHDV